MVQTKLMLQTTTTENLTKVSILNQVYSIHQITEQFYQA